MTKHFHRPLKEGAPVPYTQVNERLSELDSQITRNEAANDIHDDDLLEILWQEQIRHTFQARLSIVPGNPIGEPFQVGSVHDFSGEAELGLFLHPFRGNVVSLYDTSETEWVAYELTAPLEIATPGTTATGYDLFLEDSSGLALAMVAWTNNTTRATALAEQDGVLVSSADAGRRYVGSFRSGPTPTGAGSNRVWDTWNARHVWSYYNRVPKSLRVNTGTASWTYNVADTWRDSPVTGGRRCSFFVGVAEDVIRASVQAPFVAGGSNTNLAIGLGLDKTDGNDADTYGTRVFANHGGLARGEFQQVVPVGYHLLWWVEVQNVTATTTWHGLGTNHASGISGTIWC